MNYLYDWLDNLGNINDRMVPVIAILGNHDLSDGRELSLKYKELFKKYIKKLNKLNIYFLNNTIYEDKYVRFVGFTIPGNFYYDKDSLNLEKKFFDDLDYNLFLGKKNKLNVAITHNPVNIVNDDITNRLSNFDIVLAGHMHNGLILPVLDNFLKGNKGFIDPTKRFFPKISRNSILVGKNKYLIISGGVTKLSKASRIFHYGNILYPMEITDININKKIKK